MSALTFHWFLPTTRDSRHVVVGGHGSTAGTAGGDRPASIEYLGQIARAAEQLGFVGALTPTGAWCEDAWLTTAMLTQVTERLKFLVALRPGQISPTLSAQMAATYQRQSHGRLLLNVVTGGESAEQRAYGDFLDKDQRYARTGEFLDIVRRLWAGGTADHRGEHLRIEGPVLNRLPDPAPQIYFGGSSPAAGEVAGVLPLLEKRGLWRHPAGPRPVEIVRSRGGRCRGRAVLTAPVAGPGGSHPGRQPGSAGVDGLRTTRVPQAGAGRSRCSRRVVPMYSVR